MCYSHFDSLEKTTCRFGEKCVFFGETSSMITKDIFYGYHLDMSIFILGYPLDIFLGDVIEYLGGI